MDSRCDMSLDSIDPESWSRLEAATEDYIKSEGGRLDEAAALLAAGSEAESSSPDILKIPCLGSRKGLVVIDSHSLAYRWNQDIAQLCIALPNTVSYVRFDYTEPGSPESAASASVFRRSREPSLTEWTNQGYEGTRSKVPSTMLESSTALKKQEPLSKRLESIISPRQIRSPRDLSNTTKPASTFKTWGESARKGMYNHLLLAAAAVNINFLIIVFKIRPML